MSLTRLAYFCRSELFFALAGGFALGTVMVMGGLFDGTGKVPMATPASLIATLG